MKIRSIELKSVTATLLRTEILYSVASARACGEELVELICPSVDSKCENNVIKVMKELKKQGRIKVYSAARDLHDQSKEAEYLLNKYPEIKLLAEKGTSIIAML